MINISKPFIGEEEKQAVLDVMGSGMIVQGPKVKELEEKFAKLCGTKYAVALNSGTAALHTALYAMNIKPCDEVITTPFSFVASSNCIVMQGAVPVFADIDEKTFDIDPKKIKEKITKKTKAILPVHLYGQVCDMKAIREIADEHNLLILEDACQAVNAELDGKKAGSFGDTAAFSLYATKNIMCGEGGIITTNNEKYAEFAKRFRHHGQSEQTRYEYYDLGYNYRMSDTAAAIALEQLKRLENFTKKRIENAAFLTEQLRKIKGITTPFIQKNVKHVFHQYTVKVEEDFSLSRDELLTKLKAGGINPAIFYPKPLHMHPFYLQMNHKEGDFPVAEEVSKKVLSLPVHPLLTKEDIQKICEGIRQL